jgi:putative ABC transport system substrate-binding protein
LTPGTSESGSANVHAFREGLRALGRVEGKSIAVAYRFAQGKPESIPAFAEELVRLNPDCIVAGGTTTIRTFMRSTKTIPIVVANMDADPVEEGMIASLARPGGNVTGSIGIQWELAGKRLELLRDLAPKASRVALLVDPGGPSGHAHVERSKIAARKLGMQLHMLEARQPEAIDRAFNAAREGRAEALSVIHIGIMGRERPRIVKLAMDSRLPAIYSDIEFALLGGLMAYAPYTREQHRRAAVFVDKILKGAMPADLPVEQPTKFELAINMKTAKALGITIPQTILIRAERVIERLVLENLIGLRLFNGFRASQRNYQH